MITGGAPEGQELARAFVAHFAFINVRVLKYFRDPGSGPNRALISPGDSLQGPTESKTIQALYPRIGFLATKGQ